MTSLVGCRVRAVAAAAATSDAAVAVYMLDAAGVDCEEPMATRGLVEREERGTLGDGRGAEWASMSVFQRWCAGHVYYTAGTRTVGDPSHELIHLDETALCTDAATGTNRGDAHDGQRAEGLVGQGAGADECGCRGVEAMQRGPEDSSIVLVRRGPPSWRDCILGSTSRPTRPIGRCSVAWWSGSGRTAAGRNTADGH